MRRLDADFQEELEAHLDMLTEDNLRRGMNPEEAARAARMRLGGLTQLQEINRELRGLPLLDQTLQDLRYGLTTLRNRPAYGTVAILTLALGIGATTVIFSAVYSVLVRPLPFENAERLVAVYKENPARGWRRNPVSPVELLAWREQPEAFEDIAAFRQIACVLSSRGDVEEHPCEVIPSNLFPLLGVAPVRGRNISPDEDLPGAPRVAILSGSLWQRRFAGEEDAVGRSVLINGTSHTVIGVMPAELSHGYASPYSAIPELWVSGIELSPTSNWNAFLAVGRLKPGVGAPRAETLLDPVSIAIGRAYPELDGWRAQLVGIRELASGNVRSTLIVLMGAVVCVLLIACANVANLTLARGAARAGEIAMRQALGASRGRLIRQLLIESLVISLAGGLLGILLAWWGSQGLVRLAPPFLIRSAPGLATAVLDWRVLSFTFAITLATTVAFGLVPAFQGTGRSVPDALKEASRGSSAGRSGSRFRSALVVSEVTLATVLLVGAGLMLRTLAQLSRVDLGFDPAQLLTLRVPLSGARYAEPAAQAEFWRQIVASISALPGVESASVARSLPVEGWNGEFFTTADRPDPPPGQFPDANYLVVGPDYFKTMRIPLRKGRAFSDADTPQGQRVVIVNEKLASLHWPGQDALGKQLHMGPPSSQAPWLSVVGVAGDVLTGGPDGGPRAELYVPYQQYPWLQSPQYLVVRAAAGVKPETVSGAVSREVRRLDKDQPVASIRTMEQVASQPLTQRRMVMALLGGFAVLALSLSTLGIYGVLSYVVAQRTREIGVCIALGAQHADVLRLVVGGGARLTLLGIMLGSAAALALSRFMTDLLFGVEAGDAATLVAVAAVLTLAGLIACYIPARRATGVDPMAALRQQ
jgi:putative ABC transport system permease protein